MSKPRILFFDIESRYIIFRGWRTGKQYVDQSQIVLGEDSDIIMISYKWLGDKAIHTLHWGLHKQDSSKMIEEFSKVVESADLAVGHNSDSFDVRHINTQRLLHRQAPIAWPQTEDTLKQIRRMFYLPSYRLDYVSKLLTGKGKEKVDFNVWVEIVENKSQKHFDQMIKYNRNDVKILEKDYKILAPYLKPKLNASLIVNNSKSECTRCGSTESRSKGIRYMSSGKYRRRQCKSCLTVYRGSKIL
jgi:DNA polymerase elongation subunit (family B)